METVRIRVPKRDVTISTVGMAIYVAACTAFILWLLSEVLMRWSLGQSMDGRLSHGVVAVTVSTALCMWMAIFRIRRLKRMAVVLDEEGIHFENVWSAGLPIAWAELHEVLTSDNHSVYALVATDHRLRIPQWAGQQLWSELERRLPLHLERKTWSTRRYVCQPEG